MNQEEGNSGHVRPFFFFFSAKDQIVSISDFLTEGNGVSPYLATGGMNGQGCVPVKFYFILQARFD